MCLSCEQHVHYVEKRLHYTCHRKSSLDFQKQSLSFLIQANVFQSLIISVINGSFFNQATVKCIQQNFYIAGPDPKELNLKSPTPWEQIIKL